MLGFARIRWPAARPPSRPGARRLGPIALLLAGALGACADDPADPETRVRALLTEVEQQIEAGDVGGAKAFVSERYRDPAGNDRRALAAWVSVKRMQHRDLYVWSRVRSVEFPEPARAVVALAAGMAGSPVSGPDDFVAMRANVYRIDLDLADEDGEWRIVSARWKVAPPSDLL